MMLVLEILFKEFYKTLFYRNYRKFILLVLKYSNLPRYRKVKIKFENVEYAVPDPFSFIWQYKEIFVDESYKFDTTSSNPIIIDCGANIGVSCLYFYKNYINSKIVAYEADPNIFSILEKNILGNRINNVEIINKAVWIHEDGIELSQEGSDGASIYSGNNKIKVDSIRLKTVLDRFDSIDLLKMDIEGAENEVIKDCGESLNKIKNIFIEYHSFFGYEQKLNEILEILSDNGFRYFIKPEADRPMPFINRMNKNNPDMDLQLNIFAYKT